MRDRRRFKRRHLVYYLKVFDRDSGKLVGYVEDITKEGVKLLCEEPLEVNEVLPLSLKLPDEMEGKEEISFDARSVWCQQDVNPDFYGVGFEIVAVSAEARRIIEGLIEEYGFRD